MRDGDERGRAGSDDDGRGGSGLRAGPSRAAVVPGAGLRVRTRAGVACGDGSGFDARPRNGPAGAVVQCISRPCGGVDGSSVLGLTRVSDTQSPRAGRGSKRGAGTAGAVGDTSPRTAGRGLCVGRGRGVRRFHRRMCAPLGRCPAEIGGEGCRDHPGACSWDCSRLVPSCLSTSDTGVVEEGTGAVCDGQEAHRAVVV